MSLSRRIWSNATTESEDQRVQRTNTSRWGDQTTKFESGSGEQRCGTGNRVLGRIDERSSAISECERTVAREPVEPIRSARASTRCTLGSATTGSDFGSGKPDGEWNQGVCCTETTTAAGKGAAEHSGTCLSVSWSTRQFR